MHPERPTQRKIQPHVSNRESETTMSQIHMLHVLCDDGIRLPAEDAQTKDSECQGHSMPPCEVPVMMKQRETGNKKCL